MIDWCSVNGALQKTLSVPGPVTVPLAAVPGPGPEEHCMHVICNLARRGGAEGGTWIWIYKMLLVSPRRLWVGVRMSASLCHVSGVTHVSHHFASQRKCHDCAPMSPLATDSLCHPGPVHQCLRISQFSRSADKLARWLMTDHHLSSQ